MNTKSGSGKGEGEGVTVKLKGEVLETVLKERAKREKETKKPFSIAEVVKEIIKRGSRNDNR